MPSRDLNDLNPRMKLLAAQLIDRAVAEGIALTVTCTLRTMAEQCDLYASGRSKPGPIVTHAKAGFGYHNFGLAIDVVPDALLALPRWGDTPDHQLFADSLWQRLGRIGQDLDLTWGGTFTSLSDRPHFQWSDGLSLAQLRQGARP